MRIIKPDVKIIEEKDPMKKIEIAGRTCYKSEAAITDDSARRFVARLMEHQHTAMLEHATFVFRVEYSVYKECITSRYLNCTVHFIGNPDEPMRYIVSGNLRAINESHNAALLSALRRVDPDLVYTIQNECSGDAEVINFEDDVDDKTQTEILAHRYTTMRFTTDRGVTHEMVRHRPFSFAQESTRYVNYTKEKFGGGNIAFIEPANFESWSSEMKEHFTDSLRIAESAYNEMISLGATPQEARALLPNAVKTEIVVTGNDYEWQHFFNLRSRGTTGAPHPDIKVIADKALELYTQKYETKGDR